MFICVFVVVANSCIGCCEWNFKWRRKLHGLHISVDDATVSRHDEPDSKLAIPMLFRVWVLAIDDAVDLLANNHIG